MNASEWVGWAAAGLTLCTFFCRDMVCLRVLALCANAAFITYGSMAELTSVLVLHLTMAPVNVWRLIELHAAHRLLRAKKAFKQTLGTVAQGSSPVRARQLLWRSTEPRAPQARPALMASASSLRSARRQALGRRRPERAMDKLSRR